MGIRGLFKIIGEYKDQVCTAPVSIRGKLLIDGYNILRELYRECEIEWASGGCYADQHKATVEFFNTLVRAGVEPIVVLDGDGGKANIEDTISRRNGEINDIPGKLRNLHEHSENKDYRNNVPPILSRMAYKASLKLIDNLQVVVADEKAYRTVVSVANHYGCPVLTNNTNYCVSELSGGVVLYEHFDKNTCSAPIYKQPQLVNFLKLQNPNLIFAIVAIMGDNSKVVHPLYHGRVKRTIEHTCSGPTSDRPQICNVAEYLNAMRVRSFSHFQSQVKKFNFGMERCYQLDENCRTVKEEFISSAPTLSLETLMESSSTASSMGSELPAEIVIRYRQGNYPESVMSAICMGKCTLDIYIGDPDQGPVSQLGLPVRQTMYGLAKSLMSRLHRRSIDEYYRSDRPNSSEKPWEYSSHKAEPMLKYENLSTDRIFLSDADRIRRDARRAICDVLQCPQDVLHTFKEDFDSEYLLAIITTYSWAQHLMRHRNLGHPELLIQSLLLNFFIHAKGKERELQEGLFKNPSWIKVYHALLEWQALYRDVCGLNSMLLSPFLELHPANILDSSFVIGLALHDVSIISSCRDRMTIEQRGLYDRITAFFPVC